MASLTKITTGKGEIRYVVRWRTAEGRAVERWAKTLQAARALRTTAEADTLAGSAIGPRTGAQTLNDYFASWIASRLVQGRPLTGSTRIGYQRLWKRTIAPTIGRRPLRSLAPKGVREWHAQLVEARGSDAGAKSYRLLRGVLATAEADDLIRSNPCKIRGAGQEHAAERPMIATSLVFELADAIEPAYRALVLLAGFAGLRTGENLGLRRRDVDVMHATITIERQAQELGAQGRTVIRPKSEAGRRTVTIPGVVVDAVAEHLEHYSGDEEAPLFIGPERGPLRRATLSRAWVAAKAVTGAPADLRLHDLRHHAATLTARTPGVTTKELMARLGHASPRAALMYQHATAERDRAIAAYLDEVIAGVERPKRASVVELTRNARGVGAGLASSVPAS